MNRKLIWIICVVFREMASLVLCMTLTYVPGYIIDALIEEKDEKKAIILLMILTGVFLSTNIMITYFTNKTEEFYKANRDKKEIEKDRVLFTKRFQEYEEYKNTTLSLLGEVIQRDSLKKVTEAVVGMVSSILLIIALSFTNINLPVSAYFIILIFSTISGVGTLLSNRISYKLRVKYSKQQENLNRSIWSIISPKYAKEVRVNNLEEYLLGSFDAARGKVYSIISHEQAEQRKYAWIPSVIKGIKLLTAYGIASMVFLENTISVGTFVIIAEYIKQMFSAISLITGDIACVFTEKLYMNEYIKFVKENENGDEEKKASPNLEGDWTIEFRNVSFSYPGNDDCALQDISLIIRKGDKVSLVGPNGSGKSTFVKLLLGLYRPTSGTILVNGTNLEELNLFEYNKLISVVFQDYALFDYSIIENISVTRNNTEKEVAEVERCLNRIQLTDIINSLPHRLLTHISKRFDQDGVLFSGGESQKLALGRMLYKGTSIMIFDEPTAEMSPVAEREMYDWYEKMSRQTTSLMVSHRMAGSRLANKIIVFDRGKVVETGSFDQLMGIETGIFKYMYELQASKYLDC